METGVFVTINGVKVFDIASIEFSSVVGGYILYHKSGATTIVPLRKYGMR